MVCHSLLQGIFPTQGSNPFLNVSCIVRRVLHISATCALKAGHARLKINIQKRRGKPVETAFEVTALGKKAQEKRKKKNRTPNEVEQPYIQILVTVDLKFHCNRASVYMAASW